MAGLPLFPAARIVISLTPKYNTIPIKTENMGRLLKESPTKIITNKEGIPIRFTSVLEDLSAIISALNQGGKFTGTSDPLPKGMMIYSLRIKKLGRICYLIIQNIVGNLYQVQDVYIAILGKVSSTFISWNTDFKNIISYLY